MCLDTGTAPILVCFIRRFMQTDFESMLRDRKLVIVMLYSLHYNEVTYNLTY